MKFLIKFKKINNVLLINVLLISFVTLHFYSSFWKTFGRINEWFKRIIIA